MKIVLLSCCLLAAQCVLKAQTNVPDMGTYTLEEKQLKECPFDKEAEAVIIFDKAWSDHGSAQELVTNRHIRIKVLKQKGIERGNIEIPFYSGDDFESISDIEASVFTLGNNGEEQVKTINRSSIFRQKLNQYWSVVKFALPDVKVGSILEYKFMSTRKYFSAGVPDWEFQRDIPTMLSSYSVVVHPRLEFAYQVYKSPELDIKVDRDQSSGKVLFEMKNVAGLRDEPYMDARKDYVQRVEFQLAGYAGSFGKNKYRTSWAELTRELLDEHAFGLQLNKHISGADDLVNKAKGQPTAYERMCTIYNYIYHNITWDGISSRWAPDGLRGVWEKRKGNSGEINLLLINLLRESGLEVNPLLVSERHHGKVQEKYPFFDQFNKVMAHVLIDGKSYVLDAAGPYTAPGLIPFSVVNTKAYLVHRKKGGIISLEEKNKKNKNRISINAFFQPDGSMKGKTTIYSYDYARNNRLRYYHQSKEKLQEYLAKSQKDLHIDSITVKETETDSVPLQQDIDFTLAPNNSGDYKLVNLNLFTGYADNPFLSDIRFSNVDFGCSQSLELVEVISLPDDMQLDAIPKNLRLIMPDTSIALVRYVQVNGQVLTARYSLEINRPVFPADEYPLLKEFYKKMINFLNEQVVLKKK